MRIMSWNVRSLRDDRSAVVRTVRQVGPDVLCLQEAPRFLRSRTQLAALARNAGLVFVCGGRASAGPALLVALRVDVEQVVEELLPRTPGLHRRGLAAAEVRLGSLHVAVGSVHLGLDAGERAEHAGRIRTRLAGLGAESTVVAGDLNETVGGPAWTRMSEGLVDVVGQSGGARPTYPSIEPRVRIDAVFVSPDLTGTSVAVSGPGLARATDHRPVVVDVGTASSGT